MEVTILGSGSPLVQTSRGGQSIAVTVDGEPLLFDCGPLTIERVVENEFKLRDITNLFFTHQHMDHNASFFQFAIVSWMYGREELTVHGPDGTESLLEALYSIYDADIGYREKFGRPLEGITEIDFVEMTESSTVTGDEWTVRTHPADHSILTYAYRIETDEGKSIVYVPDTEKKASLGEFAAGADVLIHDACVGPRREPSESDPNADLESWQQFIETNPRPTDTPLVDVHTTAREAAEIAETAAVDTLVLTHLLPLRDLETMRSDAEDVFSGTVMLAEDGLTISV